MLIDIGVNLTGSSFKNDLDDVITRACEAGVGRMVVTGTDIEHSRQALDLCTRYPDVLYATSGVHPHHAKDCDEQTLEQIRQLAESEMVVAIGECGLDFNRNFSPPDVQCYWFEAQLELAAALQMPVFLHERDAHDQFLAIIARWRDELPAAVVHCFTGDAQQARAYMDLDLYIGVTGWICDERRGADLQQAVRVIADDRLMLETDAPYLLPRDLKPSPRDRRNEPMYLPHVCRAVARFREQDEQQLAAQTTANACRFFKLPPV